MRTVVSEQEVDHIVNVLAQAANPNTSEPFSNYTAAVQTLIRALIECYDLYPTVRPDPDGDFLHRLTAAFDMLNSEMAATPDLTG